jgi:hypothetical protein
MPLLDLDWGGGYRRDLRSFLFGWSSAVGAALNRQLAEAETGGEMRFLAEMACRTRLKTVETIRLFDHGPPHVYTTDGRETNRRYPAFDPPPATRVAPARFIDRVGVDIIDRLEGPQVGAAVLFVCPDHKQDSDAALAFAVRAAGLMNTGVGVVIVDIAPGLPSWATHLHSLTGVYPAVRRPRGNECPVLVVHPTFRDDTELFAVWDYAIVPGCPLPTVPVPVRGAMHLKLDLEATYAEACERSRIP